MTGTAPSSVWTSVRGLPVHARVWGGPEDATPIVLVHGMGVSGRYMVPLGNRLALQRTVYAPDLPGYGRSGKPRHVLDIPEQADALLAWMDALGLSQPALLGNSLGCLTVTEAAARYPGRVARVVLVSPVGDPQARTLLRQVGRWLLEAPHEARMGPLLLRDYLDCGLRRVVRLFLHSLAYPMEQRLPLVPAPALVVWGTRDHLVTRQWAQRVAALLPQGRLAVIPGAAHPINYLAPLELARVTQPLLDTLGRGGGP